LLVGLQNDTGKLPTWGVCLSDRRPERGGEHDIQVGYAGR